jgi:hypothetical protein
MLIPLIDKQGRTIGKVDSKKFGDASVIQYQGAHYYFRGGSRPENFAFLECTCYVVLPGDVTTP